MLKNCEKATLDNDSLFTNISLDKTIDLCVDRFYNDNENTPKIFKDVFRNLLKFALSFVICLTRFLCLKINSINKWMCGYGISIGSGSRQPFYVQF